MHLGVIPDGNRRYAEENDIAKDDAYRKARETIKSIGKELEDRDVEEVTFYLLSEENLRRPEHELELLFDLLRESVEQVAEEFGDNGYRFNWASTNPGVLPEDLVDELERLEEEFGDGDKTINALISYSGKKDILQASEKISGNGMDFTRESLKESLQIGSEIDFVIRTGNNPYRECLSGFPIWNASYAEYYHIQKNFPAVEMEDVEKALIHYNDLRRKKGK